MKSQHTETTSKESERPEHGDAPNGRPDLLGLDGSAAWVWGKTLLDRDLPPEFKPPPHAWKTIYALHIGHMRGDGSAAFPSAELMAAELGCAEKTVRNDLVALKKLRLIRPVARHKRAGQGFEYQPDLPDAERVAEIALRWRARAGEAGPKRGKANQQRATGSTAKRSGNGLPDREGPDPAMGASRSGNGRPADTVMGYPREVQLEHPNKNSIAGSAGNSSERMPGRDLPGGLLSTLSLDDAVQRLAALSQEKRPSRPISPAEIRKHLAALIEEHGLREVEGAWIYFLMKLERAGPKWFAVNFPAMRKDAAPILRGYFGPKALVEKTTSEEIDRVRVVRD